MDHRGHGRARSFIYFWGVDASIAVLEEGLKKLEGSANPEGPSQEEKDAHKR